MAKNLTNATTPSMTAIDIKEGHLYGDLYGFDINLLPCAKFMNCSAELREHAEATAAELAEHLQSVMGLELQSSLVVVFALLAFLLIICLTAVGIGTANGIRRRRRARANALIVEMASTAPEDDAEDHESEQHSHPRAAAPGESDVEEERGQARARAKK